MNEANVEALRKLLADYVNDEGCIDAAYSEAEDLQRVAAWLASHGVLVPSVLTGDGCHAVCQPESRADGPFGLRLDEEVRQTLARIAREG